MRAIGRRNIAQVWVQSCIRHCLKEDSGAESGWCLLMPCRGCVERPTLWWVNQTLAELPRVPSLAFVHVPVPEFMRVWNAGAARGSKHEDVNCPMHDTGALVACLTALLSCKMSSLLQTQLA